MVLRKKQLGLALALLIGLGGLTACNNQNNKTNLKPASEEGSQMSTEASFESVPSVETHTSSESEKEYDKMTKDEKISYLEDRIFNIRVKARSLEMKLEENPQYTDEEKEKIQDSLDATDKLIENLNSEIDKLENK